jgi:PKD repeat protein
VQFIDSSTNTPTSWVWSFGDGNTSTLENPSHTYVSAGSYTVTLTATNAGGSNTITREDYITVIFAEPVAGFTANMTNGTLPLYVAFTDSTINSPTAWSWSFGDGGTSTAQNPMHKYIDEGTFTVSLTTENDAGSNTTSITDYITVTAVTPPVASFTTDLTAGTVPFTVHFTDSSTGSPTSWVWSFGDGVSSTEKDPTHTYTTAGSYAVTLTTTNTGGSRTITASSYITVSAVAAGPTTGENAAWTPETTAPPPASTPTGTAALASAWNASSFPFGILGLVAVSGISISAVLYFRRPPRGGGHHKRDSRL